MTEASTILKMIETVSPDDQKALHEIDARVWCCVRGFKFIRMRPDRPDMICAHEAELPQYGLSLQPNTVMYTRSRDALKAIRPENYRLEVGQYTYGWHACFTNHLHRNGSPGLPTEELAELYAVIQAIEYERTKS